MPLSPALLSSKSEEWGTPGYVFAPLHDKFEFTLDAAASDTNALLPKFWTKKDDGLSQSWKGERVWLNPPYGRGITKKWAEKCAIESTTRGTLVVALLPFRPGSEWFRTWVIPYADLYVYRGRIKFEGATDSAPFDSCLAIYTGLHNQKWFRM